MSSHRKVQQQIRVFTDLHDVLDAMRNVALLEIGKLTHAQEHGRLLLEALDKAAQLAAAYQPSAVPAKDSKRLYVVLGSERGFCGDFNARVLARWEAVLTATPDVDYIVVGQALADKLDGSRKPLAVLPGALTAEELDSVLLDVVHRVAAWQSVDADALAVSVLSNDSDGPAAAPILPFVWPRSEKSAPAPSLLLAPAVFVRHFTDYYVDAKIHDAFATSLLAENRARLQHITAAQGRLDERLGDLRRRLRRLRREEITEEVETILVAAEATKV